MSISKSLLLFAGLAALHAQTPTPTAYTVTEVNSMFGPTVDMTVYRNGSKALVDTIRAGDATNPKGSHTRSMYDLQTHKNFSWDPTAPDSGCSAGTYGGDWGDPFAMSEDVTKQGAKPVGTETLNGMAAKVLEAPFPDGKIRAWIDPKTGLLIKAQIIPTKGEPKTMLEVKHFNPGPPAASLFALPAACAAAANAPHVPTEAERIDAATGGHGADFVNAMYGPGSKNSCTVMFRMVQAGSMQPIASGFQLLVDTTYDMDHPPSYVMGIAQTGEMTFSGGGIHPVPGPIRNGVLRVDNLPPYFNIAIAMGKAGGAGPGLAYRQCFGPQTVLLFVVKNPEKLSEGGDWLWAKSGKFAIVQP